MNVCLNDVLRVPMPSPAPFKCNCVASGSVVYYSNIFNQQTPAINAPGLGIPPEPTTP